jgi:hypothetical protein
MQRLLYLATHYHGAEARAIAPKSGHTTTASRLAEWFNAAVERHLIRFGDWVERINHDYYGR